WETMIGFDTVLAVLDEDDPARSGRLPMLERLARIRELLDAGDPHLHARFTTLVDDLVRGVGVLADVLNPQAIVLADTSATSRISWWAPCSRHSTHACSRPTGGSR